MKLDGKRERTYDTYRDLFDEVKKSNQLKFYSYSYVLLYSFFEDRLKRLFETQCQVKNGHKPRGFEMRFSNEEKLRCIRDWGLVIGKQGFLDIRSLSKRRNEIVHESLFNIKSVTLKDIERLEKIGRYLDRIRKKQKKNNPDLFPKKKSDKLKLKFDSKLPDVSKLKQYTTIDKSWLKGR